MSTRAEIISILCDTSIFPVGCTTDLAVIQDYVKRQMSQTKGVKDIDKSIRQALETIYSYPGYKDKRKILRVDDCTYEFLEVL